MKSLRLIMIIIFIVNMNVIAQQDSQYTQYMYNTIVVNPAYAGTSGLTSINAIYRSQWVGLEGAPNTQTFSVNSPLGEKIGMGLSGVNDIIGPSKETTIFVDFAYRLKMNNDDLTLSLGLKAGVGFFNIDYNMLNIYNPNDEYFQGNSKQISPKLGVGTYLYSSKWYIGLSSPNMISYDYYSNNTKKIEISNTHYHLIGGYVFNMNRKFKLKPAALIKYVKGAPLSVDMSVNMMVDNRFTTGVSYRLNDSISLLASIKITDSLTVGYAYDINNAILNNSGSHEIFLRFDISNIVKGKVSPRFF
ncbi:MAG: type IX secretion system membrane protein PorP/SprF [Flavobacteriaceae bacterium]|nr:type IX secretion system membrane protein PorP/SprF [Flavobacteriaceae bacterium]